MGEPEERPLLEALFRFSHGHRVRYDEVDAQGIVGNASWLNLIQLGRIEYLRYLGLMMEGGSRSPVQAVVRRAVVDYLAPARFDDALAIRVRTAQLGNRSARLEYSWTTWTPGCGPWWRRRCSSAWRWRDAQHGLAGVLAGPPDGIRGREPPHRAG